MRKPTEEEKKLRNALRELWRRFNIVLPMHKEDQEALGGILEVLVETAWMKEPEDPTERLWELAEKVLKNFGCAAKLIGDEIYFGINISYKDFHELKQLVEERKRGEH